MSHVMRKPVFAICEQQRCRSASASTQSDQCFAVHFLDSIIAILPVFKLSRHSLVSVVEQAGLSHTWFKPLKTGFLVMVVH